MAATSEPNGLSRVERELWVSLKYHLEALSGERQKLTEEQFKAHGEHHMLLAENIKTALAAQDRRLDSMNEFRASLDDMSKQGVRRDIFDIVVNRLTVVETTYLPRAQYLEDSQALALQLGKETKERDRRITELEKTAVTQTALDAQRREAERSRKSFTFALVAVGAAALLNFLVNIYQSAHGG